VDSGGNGFTDELPVADPKNTKLKDLWGNGVAQEFSEVSPAMHEEFGLIYQKRVLELFGINSYGCCEPYTHKFDMVKKNIPGLRRMSVSPWCDIDIAAEKLGKDIIFSWKINPSVVLHEESEEALTAFVRNALRKTQGCVLEIFLKDIIRLNGKADRIPRIARILRREITELRGGAEFHK